MPPAAGGFAPKPPASGSWGLRPQTPIGLRRLGAPPPDPPNSPPHCEFLATRLVSYTRKGKPIIVYYENLWCFVNVLNRSTTCGKKYLSNFATSSFCCIRFNSIYKRITVLFLKLNNLNLSEMGTL